MRTGWIQDNKKWYFLDEKGAMAVNCAVLSADKSKVWLIGSDGVMLQDAMILKK